LRISKKEARESAYWLKLVESSNPEEQKALLRESQELLYILAAIITKTTTKQSS
jgi:four helix bundle protein